MKRTFIIAAITLFILSSQNTFSQDRELNNIGFGIQLQQVQNDFGFGVHLLSPSFGYFRAKGSYNLNWFIHESSTGQSTWTTYSSFNFGTRYQTLVSNYINIYVEGGPQILLNNAKTSSEEVNFGGYGLFGFEFFLSGDSNTSYFIELGASGNNSKADKTFTKPKMGNGFITSVGYRF